MLVSFFDDSFPLLVVVWGCEWFADFLWGFEGTGKGLEISFVGV